MKIEKISESFIKPSSPTPLHLKTLSISLIDQFLMDGGYIPLLFFFSDHRFDPSNPIPAGSFSSGRSHSLKQSLAKTLTQYYPLAGRIKDHLSVDCNDEGVYYVEARANILLSEHFEQPDHIRLMHSLMPRPECYREPACTGSYVVQIQETTFACGSITIGLFGNHMVMDAGGLISFVKSWSAAMSSSETIAPSFDGGSVFPPHRSFRREATLASFDEPFLRTGRHGARSFEFDSSSIFDLKNRATSLSVVNPSRVEVVTSFIFECISDMLKAKSGVDRPFAFTYIVSWKRKVVPQLPENLFGNFVWMASGLATQEEIKLAGLVPKARETIKTVNTDFVNDNVQSERAFSKLAEMIKETQRTFISSAVDGVNYIMVSSLCNLGLYEIDFGWGKPIWVTCVDVPIDSSSDHQFLNSMVIMDSRTGKGLEAWVFMDEEDLVSLEKHEKLIEYASVNPSPLKLRFPVSHP